MKTAFSRGFLAALLASTTITAAHAATNLQFLNLTGAEYDTAGVFVTGDISFTATQDDGSGLDSVLFELYDDFTLKFSATYSAVLGSTGVFHFNTFYSGLVGTTRPGVGLYLTDDGIYALELDPYFVPHYSDPGQCQINCGPTGTVPEPASWAMFIGGFGMIGAAMRGRRPKVVFGASA